MNRGLTLNDVNDGPVAVPKDITGTDNPAQTKRGMDAHIIGDDSVAQSNQIAQARPADTNAVSIINPTSGQIIRVTKIIVCNTASTQQRFRLFHDASGTTYDQTTALFYDTLVRANESFFVRLDNAIRLTTTSENLAVRSDLASAFNFLVYGQITTT